MKKSKISNFLPFLVVTTLILSLFAPLVYGAEDTLVATYAYANADTDNNYIKAVHPSADVDLSAIGQTFTVSIDCYSTELHIQLKKVGSPAGYLTAKIEYATAISGTPNGTLVEASSTHYTLEEITAVYAEYVFYFSQTVELLTTQTYGFYVYCENATLIDGSNRICVGSDSSSATGTGILSKYYASTFNTVSGNDMVYELYANEDILVEPTPTPTPSNDWYDTAYMAQIASYVVILALIFIPVGILAKTANLGVVGALIGLAIGTGLSYLLFPTLVPIWLVFLVAMGIVALLYKQVQR